MSSMMMNNMKIGDTVTLKSGGPVMTITYPHTFHTWSTIRAWECQWFEGTTLKTENFAAAALQLTNGQREIT